MKILYIEKSATVNDVVVLCHVPGLVEHVSPSLKKVYVYSWSSLSDLQNERSPALTTDVELTDTIDLDNLCAELLRVLPVNHFLSGGIVRETRPASYTLAAAQQARWEAIKQERTAREYGPFTWDGSLFDADSESQRRIQGAAQLAMIATSAGQPFSIDWTLYDNTVRTLSGPEMIAVGLALGQHVATQYAIGRTLRAAINAATTIEEVEAVQWP